jgi:hypothetical protein
MVQDAIATVILCAWLGGMATDSKPGEVGRLLTLEDIGQAFNGLWPLLTFPSFPPGCDHG